MATFLIGLAVLLVGGYVYGKFVERIFGPDARTTPAYAQGDGVNYVPMKKWKNARLFSCSTLPAPVRCSVLSRVFCSVPLRSSSFL